MYFKEWREYFFQNQNHFDAVNFLQPDLFGLNEKTLFNNSLQQFQRGEHSEGKHLLKFAKQYGDPDYIEAIRLFIKEEQKHAIVLGKFLDMHGIPRIKDHWVDAVFRTLRQLAGIENTITILLVAEIISKIYYRALMQASASSLLRGICMQILKDEEKHLHFQCVTLKRLQQKKSFLNAWFWQLYLKIILNGTIAVVWMYHKSVLKKGGLGFKDFYRSTNMVLKELLQMIKGHRNIPAALSIINHELLIA